MKVARLLIVESQDRLRRALARILEGEGHSVRVASSVRSAKSQLRRNPFDLVVSEVSLVTTDDGLAVLDAASHAVPRPHVVFIARMGSVRSALAATWRGAYDYLQQPFQIEELLATLDRALKDLRRKDVFVCHASGDKQRFVTPFVKCLRRRRISFWVDEAEIRWGDSITRKISDGLAAARYVVVFLTDAFLDRRWPEIEMNSALSREASTGETVVLPVLAANRREIFLRYPLLEDKAYALWRDGPDALAERLKRLLSGDATTGRRTRKSPGL